MNMATLARRRASGAISRTQRRQTSGGHLVAIDDDMREATDARFRALVELHRRRRESASRFNEEKQARRNAGLRARHRRKLTQEAPRDER